MKMPPGHARILVVDNDPASLASIENCLQGYGYRQLRLLGNSTRATAHIVEFEPDLVISEFEMPGVDGIRLVELVQEITAGGDFVPILMVAAHDAAQKRFRALAAGATDFLAKPLQPSEFESRVANLLRIRCVHRALRDRGRDLEQAVAERTTELDGLLMELVETRRLLLKQERLRAFAEMASGVVHDFNNVLATITGYSELLLRDSRLLEDRDERLRAIRVVHTAASGAVGVLRKLSEFYNARDARSQPGDVDLNAVVEHVIEVTRPKWQTQALAADCRIEFTTDLAPLPPVRGYIAELREVVASIIFNAVDAMPEGGTVTCRTRGAESHALLEIEDSGCGMSAAVRERCTEPHFTTKPKHAGLGLAMAAQIVERHGGGLDIESAQGIGTTLRIRLPLSAAATRGEPAQADPCVMTKPAERTEVAAAAPRLVAA